MKRLSGPVKQALEDIQRSGNPWARVHGQAQHGGWNAVMGKIHRERWASWNEKGRRWKLTAIGEAALKGDK